MSRFYNNNVTITHSKVYLNNNNQTNMSINRIALNKSNVSMNSMKMLTYLEKFFVKKQEEQVYGLPIHNLTGQKVRKGVQSRN